MTTEDEATAPENAADAGVSLVPTSAATSILPASKAPDARTREYGLGIVKGLIGAIPYAGGLLNEVLFEARSRLKARRLEEFIAELAEAIGRLEEKAIDREFIQSEEFSDLAEDVLLRVSRNRSAGKRQHFRTVLVKGVIGVRPPNFSSLFLGLLEEMTDEELHIYENYYRLYLVLRQRRAEGKKIQVTALDYSAKEIMGLPSLVFRQVLQSLIRKGLIFDDSHGRLSTNAYEVVEPTDLGAAFFEWVRSDDGNAAQRGGATDEASLRSGTPGHWTDKDSV